MVYINSDGVGAGYNNIGPINGPPLPPGSVTIGHTHGIPGNINGMHGQHPREKSWYSDKNKERLWEITCWLQEMLMIMEKHDYSFMVVIDEFSTPKRHIKQLERLQIEDFKVYETRTKIFDTNIAIFFKEKEDVATYNLTYQDEVRHVIPLEDWRT